MPQRAFILSQAGCFRKHIWGLQTMMTWSCLCQHAAVTQTEVSFQSTSDKHKWVQQNFKLVLQHLELTSTEGPLNVSFCRHNMVTFRLNVQNTFVQIQSHCSTRALLSLKRIISDCIHPILSVQFISQVLQSCSNKFSFTKLDIAVLL